MVSTSKVPSDRLDKAISDLEAGEDFDTSLEEEDDENWVSVACPDIITSRYVLSTSTSE